MEKKWQDAINKKNSKVKEDLEKNYTSLSLTDLESLIEKEKNKYFDLKPNLATRQCSMASIESISALFPQLIGGSADLSGSNNTKLKILKLLILKILMVIIFIME